MALTNTDRVRGPAPELQPYWDWRAAGNFICGGAGAGLLCLAALAARGDRPLFILAGLAGLALVGAGLVCVLIELGRPLRALNVFLRPRTSWMSREAIAAAALFPAVLAAIVFPAAALAALAGVAALAFLYCQARLLKAARGVPAFRQAAIVPLIVLSGLAEGGALLIILGAPLGFAPTWLLAAMVALVAGRLYVWCSYRSALSAPGAAPIATAAILAAIDRPLRIGGHLLPMALLLLAAVAPVGGAALALAGGAAALAAGVYLKFTIVTGAAYNQGFAIPRAAGYGRRAAKPGWT